MGDVYKARHERLDSVVALKVLRRDRLDAPTAVRRFQREIAAVGRLDYPNVVAATDAGEADGVHFLVTEYVEGCDLKRLVASRGPLGVAEACEVARQAAEALDYSHRAGLVHCDVKPSNLLLNRAGQVKVVAGGVARLRDGHTACDDLTIHGDLMGTADFFAPE
jgi:serine/threonine protein kinase